MKLVPNARRAWRWFSVQALALAGLIPVAWASVPLEWQQAVPKDWMAYGAAFVAVLGIVGRLVDQGGKT